MLVTATLAPDTPSSDTRRSSCGARARERECASLDTRHRGSARTVAAAGATTTTTATTTTLRKPRRAREAPTRRAQIISAGRDRLPPVPTRSVATRLACLHVCTYIQYLSNAVVLDLRERAKGRRVRGTERERGGEASSGAGDWWEERGEPVVQRALRPLPAERKRSESTCRAYRC